MDWSDEAKARLEEEEKRLRLKAANLQERHGAWSLMAKQELVVANDISAALEEIEQRGERLAQWEREEVTRAANCCGQEERAEAAEAKLAEAEALLAIAQADRAQLLDMENRRGNEQRMLEAKLAEAANARVNWGAALAEVDRLTAEVERLREALRECQRVFDHPAFTDRAGIGDVVRAALRGER